MAKPGARIVCHDVEVLERTRLAEFTYRLAVHLANLGVVDARSVVLHPCPARMVASRTAPFGVVDVHPLRQIRRIYRGGINRLESVGLEYLRTSAQSLDVLLRVLHRQVSAKLLRHIELEERRTVHCPVRVGVLAIHRAVPLPHRRFHLVCGKMRCAKAIRYLRRFFEVGKVRRFHLNIYPALGVRIRRKQQHTKCN